MRWTYTHFGRFRPSFYTLWHAFVPSSNTIARRVVFLAARLERVLEFIKLQVRFMDPDSRIRGTRS